MGKARSFSLTSDFFQPTLRSQHFTASHLRNGVVTATRGAQGEVGAGLVSGRGQTCLWRTRTTGSREADDGAERADGTRQRSRSECPIHYRSGWKRDGGCLGGVPVHFTICATSLNPLNVLVANLPAIQPRSLTHSMEMILAPLDVAYGQDAWPSPPLGPVVPADAPVDAKSAMVRLPSLFAKDRSPRLVGMSDVLSAASPLEKRLARLPSIDAMIRRDESPRSPVEQQAEESLSPVQKQCMDLYRQLQDVSPSPLELASPQREHALSNLLAGAALSQLASMPSPDKKRRLSATIEENERPDKLRRPNSAKLCGVAECKKRAKAGGFCIAHGGGLRCSEEGCQKHAVSLGLCISHGGGKRCTVDGCMNASRKNGVCWSHGGKRLCKLEGCNKGPKSGGYCWSHGGKLKK